MESAFLNWEKQLIKDKRHRDLSLYASLFSVITRAEFEAVLPDDFNRIDDALNLRYRFAYDKDISYEDIDTSDLSHRGPKLIDLMIGCAFQVYNLLLKSDGDVTVASIFWDMVSNLGLDDPTLTRDEIELIIHRFLTRSYSKDGHGCLFVTHQNIDMRELPIWDQMQLYIRSKYSSSFFNF